MSQGMGMSKPPEPLPFSGSAPTSNQSTGPNIAPSGSVGLVRVVSPEEAERARKEQAAAHANLPQMMPDLVQYARHGWEAAKKAKVQTEEEMIEAVRMRKGEYSAKKLQEIRAKGGSEAYFNLPETKCRAAKAWIEDIIQQPGQAPYAFNPSADPELSPVERMRLAEKIREAAITQAVIQEQQTGVPVDVNQLRATIEEALVIAEARISDAEMGQAKATAEKMQKNVEDKLDAAGFDRALRDFIDDIVTFHCAILKGPFGRTISTLGWKQTPHGFAPAIVQRPMMQVKRVSPLNLYPAPDSTGPNDGDLYERTRYTRRELEQMKGIPGYQTSAIDAVLYEHRSGGLREWLWTDHEVDRIRNISQLSSYSTSKIDGLECYLSVPGSLLADWNVPGVNDLTKEYEIVAIMIGRHLIYVTLNPHPLNERPYSVASMMRNPDGFWGRSIPQSIKHDADAANMLFRSAINNAAMSAGPLVQEIVDRLAPGEVPGEIYPMKTYLTTDDLTGSNRPPVEFFNVPMTAHQLIDVLKFVAAMADEHSGIPAYAHGSEDVGGAGDTASGLSMLMNAAAKGVKNVVKNIDEAIEDLLQRVFVWEMLYNPDPTIKGDLEVKARGSSELLIKEQLLIRRKEILEVVSRDPDLKALAGPQGLANLFKGVLKGADLPVDEILPQFTESAIVRPDNNQMQGQPPQPMEQGQQAPQPHGPARGMGGQAPASQATNAAGQPAGGQSAALFSQGG